MKLIINKISSYFLIEEMNTTFKREILAWIWTFLSLSYIFIVNPAILSKAWMSIESVTFATIIASGISTLIMWLWARLPFALAPWLEMNWFFAFVVVWIIWLTWQQSLWIVFLSWLLCLLFTVVPFRKSIINSIPDGLKSAISFSVWIFVLTIWLFLAWIVKFDNWQISNIWEFFTTKAIVLYIWLVISIILWIKKIHDKLPIWMLVWIVVASFYAVNNWISSWNEIKISTDMFWSVWKLDLFSFFDNVKFIPVLLVFFLLDYFWSIWKFIWLTSSIKSLKDTTTKNMSKAMYVDWIWTVWWAILWTSSVITYVESAVWIWMWWRTWIVAVVCWVLMLLSLFLTPLIWLVPVEATSWILVYVWYLLIPKNNELKWIKKLLNFDMIVSILLWILTFLTFWLDKALALWFILYLWKQFFNKEEKLNWYLFASTILISLSVILQFILK
jgi:AGZA family xanthine/uracil permease-like MFS transporter